MPKTTVFHSSISEPRKPAPRSHLIRNGILGLVIFAITSSLSVYTLHRNNPLFLFIAEEYVELGWNYYQYGNFYGSLPVKAVFRPPGYSLFCSGIFLFSDKNPGKQQPFEEMTKNIPLREKVFTALEHSQALLLGLSAILVYAILTRYLNATHSVILALLFGCNPYSVILTGLYHYDIIHIFLTLLATWLLTNAITKESSLNIWLIGSGIAWGLATLVRPITLILPCFILLLFLYESRGNWKNTLYKTVIFTVAMLIIIAPWTIRNYNLTHKIIPVNAQTGIALWAATSKINEIHPNHYGWMNIWYPSGDELYKKVTGFKYTNNIQYAIFSLQMEDEFKKIVLSNLKNNPSVYLLNIISNMALFVFNMNDVLVKVYEAFQEGKTSPDIWVPWITPGNPQNFHSSHSQHFFYAFIILLTCMSFGALFYAIKNRATPVLAVAAAFACISTAYSISYLDLMYYSIKLPFIFLLAGYFLSCINSQKIPVRYGKFCSFSPASALLCVMSVWVVLMSFAVLFNS